MGTTHRGHATSAVGAGPSFPRNGRRKWWPPPPQGPPVSAAGPGRQAWPEPEQRDVDIDVRSAVADVVPVRAGGQDVQTRVDTAAAGERLHTQAVTVGGGHRVEGRSGAGPSGWPRRRRPRAAPWPRRSERSGTRRRSGVGLLTAGCGTTRGFQGEAAAGSGLLHRGRLHVGVGLSQRCTHARRLWPGTDVAVPNVEAWHRCGCLTGAVCRPRYGKLPLHPSPVRRRPVDPQAGCRCCWCRGVGRPIRSAGCG